MVTQVWRGLKFGKNLYALLTLIRQIQTLNLLVVYLRKICLDFYATFRFLHFTCWVFSSLWLLLMRPLFGGDNFLNALKFCMYLVWMLSYAFSTMYYLQTFSQLMPCHKLLLVGSHSNIPSKLVCDGLGCNNIIIQFNRYPANVPEKNLKKKRKELLWGSRLSSYKIESIQEGIKPCII